MGDSGVGAFLSVYFCVYFFAKGSYSNVTDCYCLPACLLKGNGWHSTSVSLRGGGGGL